LPAPADDTRTRLLKAAAEVFADRGYENATIRQICTRAEANVALVNYHFGDKLELYTEVLRFSLQPGAGAGFSLPRAAAEPADALRQIVGALVERAFETGDQPNLRFRLMLNEFIRPSGAILKLPADHDKTRLCVHSILGQVAHFAHSRQMLGLLWPEMKMTPAQRELVAEHITRFSLAYLHGTRSGGSRSAVRRRRGQ
jgi:TetR/AcrR family transcriptional regulator, regulator of cefoperazone and chloramphenicol sensitivity